MAQVGPAVEGRKRAVEPQQLHTSNKQLRVVESAPACKSIWSVFDDDVEQPLPDSFPLLSHLPLRDESAAFREACAEREQIREQEKAEEDARAAAFDDAVGRKEWPPRFQRTMPSEADAAAAFCAPNGGETHWHVETRCVACVWRVMGDQCPSRADRRSVL